MIQANCKKKKKKHGQSDLLLQGYNRLAINEALRPTESEYGQISFEIMQPTSIVCYFGPMRVSPPRDGLRA